ncbi:similar to Saccharomyces cerevisiae YDR137W RGP1 Subunit of a Golgi membrane exchange factor (Ric1p-Rgp1p) that catalyzes nucleotide exchange on Ypt6p [Maudiozyma saulgeensis]|uniref:Similar to Saccharomyces cerevisiae YDR137W RGP1 Subunit of a Golgi membrane exchange factor (Ric1p-Rgp1p) that catalyzes nucleotide exchange on Ypt6p n=1 Tax=Maudiozyma saulgeensis TaxID=1789683 RepID=A0A1X7R630_9SACH|nr:similar to Saccharomyces cerevisiae YDR137W RGP1 Subunit of a Golgi membrane exchange factor (Ric1p-Rgp1p) that catalyzes nucleotide exchange on Ypt6p [Kazachstania saulgeensis]
MHDHRIDSLLIADNVRLEIVHESNPYFAGEQISFVVRLRHLGSVDKCNLLKEKIEELHKSIETRIDNEESILHEQNEQNNGHMWSMKNLFGALRGNRDDESGDHHDIELDNERYGEYISKQIQYHKPVNLMAGFVQVLGIFQYSPDTIKSTTFDTSTNKLIFLNQSTHMTVNNVDGIPSESNEAIGPGGESSDNNTDPKYLKKYFQSHFKFGPQDPDITFDSTDLPTFNVQDFFEEYDNLPFLVIPQSLLFPELTLRPGEVKSYHFKSNKLPNDLCPSYKYSENMAINYYVEFGVNKVESNQISPLFIKSPIYISPLVTSEGCQYTSELGSKPYIMEPGTIKEVVQTPNVTRKHSTDLSTPFNRRKSSISIRRDVPEIEVEKLKNSFVDLIKKTENYDDIEDLVDFQLNLQFGKQENDSITNSIKTNTATDSTDSKLIFNQISNSSKENISSLKRLPLSTLTSVTLASSSVEGTRLEPQLVNPQKNYIINRNGETIATAAFSKIVYTVTDDINITIQLADNPNLSVSGINASLELIEVINSNYLNDTVAGNAKNHNIRTISSARVVSFDETGLIPLKLTIPKSPMNLMPSQFKTNVFQVKWSLLLRFILIPKSSSSNVFEFYGDKKGIFFHSTENIEGEEFDCRVPISILPTTKDMGGW